MTDQTKNDGAGAAPSTAQPPQAQPAADAQPQFQLVTQYVKDLSFENPGAPASLAPQRPKIDLNFDIQVRRFGQDQYEVELKFRVTAATDGKSLFVLELTYGGLFALRNVPEDQVQPLLLIQGPQILFPFARRIVADSVRDGGLPPLLIEPIDFLALYRARMNQEAGAGSRAPGA